MKRKGGDAVPIIFRPAITPLEAAVLPAMERTAYSVLSMIRYAYEASGETEAKIAAQRAKIWVR